MGRKKSDAPKVEKVKKVALKKDGTPRAKPERKGPLGTLAAKIATLAKSEAAKVTRDAAIVKLRASIEGTLSAWGHPTDSAGFADAIASLTASGFVPPKGRVRTEAFTEGSLVQLKPDFVQAYLSVYSQAEIGSMIYSFFDDVNKRAMCTSDGRVVAVKSSHIEPRGTVHDVVAPAAQ